MPACSCARANWGFILPATPSAPACSRPNSASPVSPHAGAGGRPARLLRGLLPLNALLVLFSSLPAQVLVGDQPISYEAYCRYADANTDELPLYL